MDAEDHMDVALMHRAVEAAKMDLRQASDTNRTDEEIAQIVRLVRELEQLAVEVLWKHNESLARVMAKKWSGGLRKYGLTLEDGTAEAHKALVKCASSWNPDAKTPFRGYFCSVLEHDLPRALRLQAGYGDTKKLRADLARLRVARAALEKIGLVKPTVEELAERAGITAEDVVVLLCAERGLLGYGRDEDVDDEDGEMPDRVDVIGGARSRSAAPATELPLDKLAPLERRVVLFYVEGADDRLRSLYLRRALLWAALSKL